MNKSKERQQEETKNTNREERGEGDEGAAQKETTGEAGSRKEEGTVSRTGASGARKKPRGNQTPWTGTPGGTQWQADNGTEPGLEHPGKKGTRIGTSGAEALDGNIRGRSGPGLERPGLHQGEEATAARKGKENMNKSNEQRREDTKKKSCDEGGEGEERVQAQPATQEGERRKAWWLGLEHPGPERSHTALGPPGLEHPGGRQRTRARSPDWNIRGRTCRPATGPPGLEHQGGRSP